MVSLDGQPMGSTVSPARTLSLAWSSPFFVQ